MPLSLNSPTQTQTSLAESDGSEWRAAESVTMAHESQSIILMAASLYQLQHFLINKSSCSCRSGGVWACGPTQTLETCFQVFFTKAGKKPESDRTHSRGRIHDEVKRSRWVLPRGEFWWWEGWQWVCTLASPPPSFHKWFAKIFAFKEDAEEPRWRMRSLTGHCHWGCVSVMKSGWLSWHFNSGDAAGSGRRTWWQ